MKEIKEHDIVIIDRNKIGTVVHIYPNDTYEIEINYFEETVVETVSRDRISIVKDLTK